MATFGLEDQITCIRREIGLRERFYPRWIEQRKMSQVKADSEIALMRAVLDTLLELQTRKDG